MLDFIHRFLGIGDYSEERTCGATRSPQWPIVREAHIKENPSCIICGGTISLQVHHIHPFHIHPELELDPNNLVTLCTGNPTINCHLKFGHFGNFASKWNPVIKDEAPIWLKRFTAKTEQELFPEEQETRV